MKLIAKFIYLIAAIILFILVILTLPNIDWQAGALMPLALLFFLLILIFSIIDIKKSILLIIFALPTIIYFNDYKIDPSRISSALSPQDLPLNLTALTCLFIIFLSIITIFSNWEKVKKLPLRYIILIYSLYIIVSVFWSTSLTDSLIGVVYFLVPFFAYIITYCCFGEKKDVLVLAISAVISSTIPIIIGFSQIIQNQLYYEPDSSLGRINSTFVHPNLFGLYLFAIIGILISVYFAKKDQRILENKLLIFFGLITTISILLTYSRVSWACLFLFLVLMTFVKRMLIAAFAALAPLAVIFAFAIERIKFRVLEVFSEARYSSWSTRKRIWTVAWREITEKPILGNGVGTSEMVIENAKDWQGGTSLPHNDFILYWLELGIIGVILFVSYTLGAIYYIWGKYKALADKYVKVEILGRTIEINYKKLVFGIFAVLIAMILASMFESTSKRIVTQIIIWSLLGSVLAQKSPELIEKK